MARILQVASTRLRKCASPSVGDWIADIEDISPVDPNAFGDPYADGRPLSAVSASTNGLDNAWRRRQTIKRGVTRKVKLTHGNFVAEYPVPTPVFSAIESQWSGTNTTEFTCVLILISFAYY